MKNYDWRYIAGVEFGQNQKNLNHSKNFAPDNSLQSLVDIGRFHEVPRNFHNKGPDCKQTGLEVDNRNCNENRAHITHESVVRAVVVEDGLQHLENR
ncbi:hypothetical protein Tco_0989169 [Tanacetum coccineum]|uniref:Uncharacterized protein n=1 Tax=Tanacetum coccineum TaxID=301880 RepID=A0ABQ5ET01_9ASTR